MRKTERHYMLTNNGDFQEITTESQDSIELKMSTKGERYWDLKIYFEPGKEVAAITRLADLDKRMEELWSTPKAI